MAALDTYMAILPLPYCSVYDFLDTKILITPLTRCPLLLIFIIYLRYCQLDTFYRMAIDWYDHLFCLRQKKQQTRTTTFSPTQKRISFVYKKNHGRARTQID